MASPSDAPNSERRASQTHARPTGDDDLTSSLQQLSIAHNGAASPKLSAAPKSPLSGRNMTPLQPPPRRSSSQARAPSRSPSSGPRSRAGSPGLRRKASTNSLRSVGGVESTQTPLRRASSGQIMSPTSKAFPNGPSSPIQEKPPLTPASVAQQYLKAELDTHHGESTSLSTQTIVILNDAVYGHRFSRPRTSRNALSTIVERPERVKAGVLGISLAYVRLGERHSEGAVSPHPKRDVQALSSIPFRIHKTTRRLPLLSQAVTNVHGTKWMEELKMMCESAESRLAMGGKELQRRPRSRTDEAVPEKLHEGDLYLCSESLNAIEGALGAVCEGIDTVFSPNGPRRAFVGVRPPGHHCSASHPSGFCWVNNVHVGIMHAVLEHGLTHAAIIDFDLHHGDGSQSVTWTHNSRAQQATKNAAPWKKTSIGYFSLHDINSYPCEGGDDEKVKNASLCIDNAHGQSIWNVHLQSWKTEQEFWQLYETRYSIILEKTRSYLRNQAQRLTACGQSPKAAIFFSAGFDASEWESAGMQRHQVNVPTEFYARLSQDVVKLAGEEGLGVDGRVVSVLEGGYSDRALFSGTCSHLSGLVADQNHQQPGKPLSGLGTEMGQKIGAVPEEQVLDEMSTVSSVHPYDPSWWSSSNLDQLESLIANPVEAPKKPRQPSSSTYSSPTQASSAKVSDPIKMRRSLSGLNKHVNVRPASPPPPEVPWNVAAHELSKLLIPSDRQVDSCKPEDLDAEATRARQARQTGLTGATPVTTPERPSSKMALRGRKPKAPLAIDEDDGASRRRTVATSTVSTPAKATPRKQTVPSAPQSARRSSRRTSTASTLVSPTEDVPPMPNLQNAPCQPPQSAVRPDLASAGRSQSAGTLPVKKTRAPAAPRKDPVAKVGRPPKKTAASTSTGVKTEPSSSRQTTQSPDDGLDNITSGMKKIKINLITQAKKEAREKAKAEGPPRPPSAGRVTRSGRSTPIASPDAELPPVPPQEATIKEETPLPIPASDPVHAPASSEQPVESTVDIPQATTPTANPQPETPIIPEVSIESHEPDVFIPYQPEGPPPETATPGEPLKWLPPNVNTPGVQTPAATPSPAKRHDNLFHYTPGSIPFAPRPKSPIKKPDLPPPQESKDENVEFPDAPQPQ